MTGKFATIEETSLDTLGSTQVLDQLLEARTPTTPPRLGGLPATHSLSSHLLAEAARSGDRAALERALRAADDDDVPVASPAYATAMEAFRLKVREERWLADVLSTLGVVAEVDIEDVAGDCPRRLRPLEGIWIAKTEVGLDEYLARVATNRNRVENKTTPLLSLGVEIRATQGALRTSQRSR